MSCYRIRTAFPLLLHVCFVLCIFVDILSLISVKYNITSTYNQATLIEHHSFSYVKSTNSETNKRLSSQLIRIFFVMSCGLYLQIILSRAGDIHPNPGPTLSETRNTSYSSSSSSESSLVNSARNMFSFVHYNVQSIANKTDLLYSSLNSFDVIAFSETWFSSATPSSDICFHGYHSPIRKDRPLDPHGGVAIYLHETLTYTRRHDLEPNGLECIWIEIKLCNKKQILFGVVYRPPNSDTSYMNLIETSFGLAADTGIHDIIITGDFNLNANALLSRRKIDGLCSQNNLKQIINDTTHFTEHSASVIDLIFVSNPVSIILSGTGEPFLNQNIRFHCPVFGIVKHNKPVRKTFNRHIWRYDQGNYDKLRTLIAGIQWEQLVDEDINIYTQNVTHAIYDAAIKSIPNKIVCIRTGDAPWMNHVIKSTIRKRKRLYHKAKISNSCTHWEHFRTVRNQVVYLVRDAKTQYFENLSNKLKSSNVKSKDWWKLLRNFISPQEHKTILSLRDDRTNDLISDETDKANMLNEYFASQSHINDNNHELPSSNNPCVHTLNYITITPNEVLDAFKNSKLGKASGPDGIDNRILRECMEQLKTPICDLLNASLTKCEMPEIWKKANVCAVFKKGDPSLLSNYRPISLLNTLEKVFERILYKHIFNFLHGKSFFTQSQSGFIPGDSAVNQLTYIYDKFCKALDNGLEVRVVFFDISKAFDKVWHKGLLHKLHCAGIRGDLLKWISNYLSDRKQKVVLPGVESRFANISAGVPQGSILGPLMFLIYINDIVSNIHSCVNLFADDTSLYMIVNSPDQTATLMQADIDRINTWAQQWLVTFNPSKSESLIISRKLNKPIHPPLTMQNVTIPEVCVHKHLGLHLTNDCSWHEHIAHIKDKAWTRINIMRRLKHTLDRKALEVIYCSFIRPILEYSDVVFDNCCQF